MDTSKMIKHTTIGIAYLLALLTLVSRSALSQDFPTMTAIITSSDRHPSLSPDNQKIVFSTGQGFDRDLAIIDLSTKEIIPITNNDDEDSHPRWSPDGEWIVFQREDTLGNRDLFVIKKDGTDEKNLTNTPKYREQHPAYSSDGSLIVFDGNRDENDLTAEEQNYEIYSLNTKTKEINRLTNSSYWDMYPSLSSDNTHLVWRKEVRIDSTGAKNFEIFIKNLTTGEMKNITNDPAYDSNPHWNPSGDFIAFGSRREGSFNVFLIKPDGTGLRKITQAEGRSIGFNIPTFSYDGKKILLDRYVKGVSDLVVIDLENE
ncbi:TolB family protein [Ekhidna sp.]|uniref:TolB family protein n=1 Tax=Ekhidna sp. TaxID=2608089 RepID=UPI003BA9467C